MKWLNIDQNSEEWYLARLGKITASKFGAVMAKGENEFGEVAKKYALDLALERITHQRSVNQVKTSHMRRGHEQEPLAKLVYEQVNFVEVTNGGFFDGDYYGDSPDGLVGVDGGIEIKSVIASVHYANLMRGSLDPTYKWQMIGHLECTGREWFDFVSYCADFPDDSQIISYRMYRDDVLNEIKQLQTKREEFNHLVDDIKTQILLAA